MMPCCPSLLAAGWCCGSRDPLLSMYTVTLHCSSCLNLVLSNIYIHTLTVTVCQPGGVILQEYALPSGETWFVKMDACIPLDMFAVGNSWGQVQYVCTGYLFVCLFVESSLLY